MSINPYGINNSYEDNFLLGLIENSSKPQTSTEHTSDTYNDINLSLSDSVGFTSLLNNPIDQEEIHSDITINFREESNIEQIETSDYTPEKPSENQERVADKKRKLTISVNQEGHSVSEVHSTEQLVDKTSVELLASEKDSAKAIEQQRSKKRKNVWTDEEVKSLQTAHSILGNQWDIIQLCLPNRTISAIKNKWNYDANPNVSRESWTSEELAKLAKGYSKYCNFRNVWEAISKNVFNENRTEIQCSDAYKKHIAGKKFTHDGFDIVTPIHTSERPILQSNLSHDSEAALTSLVHTTAQRVDKTSVESLFGDQNLEKTVDQQTPKKGKNWTSEQNNLLEAVHMIHENNWNEIQQLYFPDRSVDAIRHRCAKLKKPNNSEQSWTDDELKALANGYENYRGYTNLWKMISQEVFNGKKTNLQCRMAYLLYYKDN